MNVKAQYEDRLKLAATVLQGRIARAPVQYDKEDLGEFLEVIDDLCTVPIRECMATLSKMVHDSKSRDGTPNELLSDLHTAVAARPPKPVQSKPTMDNSETSLADVLPLEFVTKCFDRGETGDSELFARMFAEQVVYDHSRGKWYKWDEHRWVADRTSSVPTLISGQLAAQYYYAAGQVLDSVSGSTEEAKEGLKGLAQKFSKRAGTLHYKTRIDRVLDLATRRQELALTGDEWDANSMLLAVGNGVVNLATGQLEDGRPSDYIRTFTTTQFDTSAKAPRWESFLEEIFAKTDETIEFLQRLMGYGITGKRSWHVFPVLWGDEGRNGKDTLTETTGYVLGGHVGPVSKAVMIQGRNDGHGATPFLCALQGKRIVWASETKDGARLNASQVKYITGGGKIVGRPLYGKPIEFMPGHLVFLITNSKPHADSEDSALWERVKLFEFTQRFIEDPEKENEHKADERLIEKLQTEASGILNWFVEGCLMEQKTGHATPAAVKLATEEYREEEDVLALFIAERCYESDTVRTAAKTLYSGYLDWAKRLYGSETMTSTDFGRRLGKKFEKKRVTAGNVYIGIALGSAMTANDV